MYFFENLERGGSETALVHNAETFSWTTLAQRADSFTADLRARLPTGITRPLLLLETANEIAPVLAYLGALRAGWPVILVAEGAARPDNHIRVTYAPNLVFRRTVEGWNTEVTQAPAAEMHPELAVLLSTSGTTGATKLVRLSRDNLQSNATAIAEYLSVTRHDCAITTLPFHYSYGMSVLNVQMLAHGPLVLTDRSVVDPAFWAIAQDTGATSLALVPTQFEMLEAAGWTPAWIPQLRYITQAGGRLDPLLARRMADRATAEGWKLFLMYGQTEAGPRMSYVPPEDARAWGHSIGRPIPGGTFRLRDEAGADITATGVVGELVFSGPGVMQGYARTREDLAAPAGPPELATGDLAERLDNGYFRITGRASRFLKLYGLRIGLDEIEATLRAEGQRVFATGSDTTGIVLFLQDGTAVEAAALARSVAARYDLTSGSVRAAPITAPPLLPSGKIDYRGLARLAEALPPPALPNADLAAVLAEALRQPDLDLERSFLDLGGDSLAYLSVQLYLSERLGRVPSDWERMPLVQVLALDRAAEASPAAPRPWMVAQPVEADLIGRVAALLSVLALHATDWPTGGGAYLLLLLTGVSLARFQSGPLMRGDVLHTLRAMLLPILVCYYALITALTLLWHPVGPLWFLLLGNFDAQIPFRGLIPYWFVCTYAQIVTLAVLPFALPAVRHQVTRHPFVAGLVALFVVALGVQFSGTLEADVSVRHRLPLAALELLLLGWGTSVAVGVGQRVAMSGLLVAVWALHWADAAPGTAVMVLGGALATLWRLRVPVPIGLARSLLWAGSLAMFAYLAHVPIISVSYRLLPDLGDPARYLLVVAGSLVGAAILKTGYAMAERTLRKLGARRHTARPRAA